MLEEKQHDKYPAQYISRRTTRRAIAHEGDRALDLAKQKIYTKSTAGSK